MAKFCYFLSKTRDCDIVNAQKSITYNIQYQQYRY